MLSFPRTKAPASSRGVTTPASSAGWWVASPGVPAVVGRCAEPIASFSANGRPCNACLCSAASSSQARLRAASSSSAMNAFRAAFRRQQASSSSTYSAADISPPAIARHIRRAPHCQISGSPTTSFHAPMSDVRGTDIREYHLFFPVKPFCAATNSFWFFSPARGFRSRVAGPCRHPLAPVRRLCTEFGRNRNAGWRSPWV